MLIFNENVRIFIKNTRI